MDKLKEIMKTLKEILSTIESWPWFLAGLICGVIALYLGFHLSFGFVGGFLAWCWKLPLAVFSFMASVQFINVGLNGDQPPR